MIPVQMILPDGTTLIWFFYSVPCRGDQILLEELWVVKMVTWHGWKDDSAKLPTAATLHLEHLP